MKLARHSNPYAPLYAKKLGIDTSALEAIQPYDTIVFDAAAHSFSLLSVRRLFIRRRLTLNQLLWLGAARKSQNVLPPIEFGGLLAVLGVLVVDSNAVNCE